MFGQLIIGPPGSGKTTYCTVISHYYKQLGRTVEVVNFDPANDQLPYPCSINICDLITLSDVIDTLHVGPNGALVYCIEYLEKNLDWLFSNLERVEKAFILIDCPGQIELYTHHNSIRNIFQKLTTNNHRFVAVNLIDSHYCSDPAKFISAAVISLNSMLQLVLPHVNVLSKCDLVEKQGTLPMNLEFFTEVLDLSFLLRHLNDDPVLHKFKKLNEVLCSIIEDYSLVSFLPLDFKNGESVTDLVKKLDHAIGYSAMEDDNSIVRMLYHVMDTSYLDKDIVGQVQERYMSTENTESTEQL